MAAIDSLLRLAADQGANELRLGTDKAPAMFASGAPKRLTMPTMKGDEVRHVLGPLLNEDRETLLRRDGQLESTHFVANLGTYRVTMVRRGLEARDGSLSLDVVFMLVPKTPAGAPIVTPAAPVAAPSGPPTASVPPVSGPAWTSESPTGVAPARAAASVAVAEVREEPAAFDQAAARRAPRALASLLAAASDRRASDLHLLTGEAPHVRVDGQLRALVEEPTDSVEEVLGELLGRAEQGRLQQGHSVDLAVEVPGAGRFRLNVFRTSSGLGLAARALSVNVPLLSSLNLPVPLDELAELPHGLVIVTGPTGAGKSTTLAALAQEALRRRSTMLITLEDPIEYSFAVESRGSLVRQRQIGREVASFATGLRDALREDPDVLLVGEMRDPESIALALTAAETGHLVLTSLHSRSAASAIERIVDAYPAERQRQVRGQLADALRAVVAQRLVPRARGGGRLPALEVLRATHAVANHIRDGRTEQLASALQTGRREGMIQLERSLADLVRAGQVTAEAARAVANDPVALAEYLRGA